MNQLFDEVPRYVVDASVLLKPALKEQSPQTDLAKELIQLKENYEICIFVPDLFRYEYFNTLVRKRGEVHARLAYKAISARQLCIFPLEDYYWETAHRLMQKYSGVSFYDASYHALAKAYNIPYITADKKYYERTKKEGNIQMLEDLY